jgi:hypothetical protein
MSLEVVNSMSSRLELKCAKTNPEMVRARGCSRRNAANLTPHLDRISHLKDFRHCRRHHQKSSKTALVHADLTQATCIALVGLYEPCHGPTVAVPALLCETTSSSPLYTLHFTPSVRIPTDSLALNTSPGIPFSWSPGLEIPPSWTYLTTTAHHEQELGPPAVRSIRVQSRQSHCHRQLPLLLLVPCQGCIRCTA